MGCEGDDEGSCGKNCPNLVSIESLYFDLDFGIGDSSFLASHNHYREYEYILLIDKTLTIASNSKPRLNFSTSAYALDCLCGSKVQNPISSIFLIAENSVSEYNSSIKNIEAGDTINDIFRLTKLGFRGVNFPLDSISAHPDDFDINFEATLSLLERNQDSVNLDFQTIVNLTDSSQFTFTGQKLKLLPN